MEELRFDASFVFIYSPRPGTPAADLVDDTPHEVKVQRLQRIQALLDAETLRITESMVGTVQSAIVEKIARKKKSKGADKITAW